MKKSSRKKPVKKEKVQKLTKQEREFLLKNYWQFLYPERYKLLKEAQKSYLNMIILGLN